MHVTKMCTKTQRKLCESTDCEVCNDRRFSSCSKSEYWSNKNIISPDLVCKNSGKTFLFDCPCGHEFPAIPNHINRKQRPSWCPFCSSPPKELCKDDNCVPCLQKSLKSHPKSDYWSNKNQVQPRQVFKGESTAKYWFDCNTCGHDFDVTPASITHMNSWCPYCSNLKLCQNLNCQLCLQKSFKSHTKSMFWSKNNDVDPRFVFKHMNSCTYWFNCNNCGHEFQTYVATVTREKKPTWCPYCCFPPLLLCDNDDCKLCFEKSFKSHKLSRFWSSENKLIPRQVFKHGCGVFVFVCKNGHKFSRIVSDVTRPDKPCWCPICCESIGEKLVAHSLEKAGIIPEHQKKFPNLRYRRLLQCDIYFEHCGHRCVIEFDGHHHFHSDSYLATKGNFEENQERDLLKTQFCLDNNIYILRIPYTMMKRVPKMIKKLIFRLSKNSINDQSIFFCDDQELYENHIRMLKF